MDADSELNRLTIRAMEPSDAEGVSVLLGSPGVVEGTLQLPEMAVASRIEHLEKIEQGACKLVAQVDGRIVASAGLQPVGASLRRSHARALFICIAAEWQGKGLGKRMMQRLLDWADNWTHVLRIELTVHADNEAAMALYKGMGFEVEGRHRAYSMKNGRLVDAFSMARLHPSPPRLP